jgi:O-Antigen ligase
MRPDRAFMRASATVTAIPAALAFVVFVILGVKDAGYPATVWYAGGLFLVVLLAIVIWAWGLPLRRLSRPAAASVASLAALTVWTYVSIAWSEVKGDAWDGANRGLLYLAVYGLFVFVALRAESIALILAGYAAAIATAGLYEFVAASRAANPDSYFLLARFSEPTGYQNANCALFTLAFWPALFLASRRQVPVVVRALMLGAAGVLVELSLLSQSRAWLASVPIVFVFYVAVVPRRVRALAFALPVGVALLASKGALLDVFPALQSGDGIREALRSARTAIVVSGSVLVLVGAVMAVVDRRLWRDVPATRLATRVAAAVFALGAVVAVVAGLAWIGNPVTRLSDAWDEFRSGPQRTPTSSYLTSGFSSNRHDIWRVALDEFSAHPVVGVGSDNFAVDYLKDRRSDEEPLYPHSLELKVVAQTGVVGGLLFLGFLVGAVIAWARRREESELSRGMRAAALVGFAYWFVHGSIDWFWELPGLAAPALAMLGLAVASEPRAETRTPTFTRRPARAAFGYLLGAAALLAACLTLGLPWLAAKEVRAAAGEWRRSPDRAFERLDRARRLDPLSDRPDLIAGAIASRLSDTRRMVEEFGDALERNPSNWYARLELGVAYAREGKRAAALRELSAARRLNPREPTIAAVALKVRRGETVSLAELDRNFLRRTFVSNRKT